jgi:pentatricopeptide repeat protein
LHSIEPGLFELMKPGSLLPPSDNKEQLGELPDYNDPELVLDLVKNRKRQLHRTQRSAELRSIVDTEPNEYLKQEHDSSLALEGISFKSVNHAIEQFNRVDKDGKAKLLFRLMRETNIPIEESSYISMINASIKFQDFHDGKRYFDELMESVASPSVEAWEAKLSLLARAGDIDEAIKTLDSLKKLNINVGVNGYNSILKAFAQKNDSKVPDFWLKMHRDGVALNADSFSSMLRYCSYRGEGERAFFYLNEMKGLGIQPNEELFCQLLRSASKVPVWISGYEDTIFDAIAVMESYEYKPSTRLYNEIILAFALAGDGVAAEYYYWEMKRKGIQPDSFTYRYLLEAYSKAQSIGSSSYGWKGRYVKAVPAPLTPYQEARKEIGARRTIELSKLSRLYDNR